MILGPKKVEVRGYCPGVIGQIVQTHAVYYHENWGFDASFETQVAKELAEFIMEFRTGRDGLWSAFCESKFNGSIAIDGRKTQSDGARLRWFIVELGNQGQGIGKALLNTAMNFCRQVGHEKVFLWTFEGLVCARHLYEEAGFRLTVEHRVNQWGSKLLEQRFDFEPNTGHRNS